MALLLIATLDVIQADSCVFVHDQKRLQQQDFEEEMTPTKHALKILYSLTNQWFHCLSCFSHVQAHTHWDAVTSSLGVLSAASYIEDA